MHALLWPAAQPMDAWPSGQASARPWPCGAMANAVSATNGGPCASVEGGARRIRFAAWEFTTAAATEDWLLSPFPVAAVVDADGKPLVFVKYGSS